MKIRKRNTSESTQKVEVVKQITLSEPAEPKAPKKLGAKRFGVKKKASVERKALKKPSSIKSTEVNKDPLHGVKLADVLNYLVEAYGWPIMAEQVSVRCFKFDPSIKSSLHFLRRTPWARAKVEEWYAKDHKRKNRK